MFVQDAANIVAYILHTAAYPHHHCSRVATCVSSLSIVEEKQAVDMTYPERWLTWCKARPAYSLLNRRLHSIFSISPFLTMLNVRFVEGGEKGGRFDAATIFIHHFRARTWQSCVWQQWCIVGGEQQLPPSVSCSRASCVKCEGDNTVWIL